MKENQNYSTIDKLFKRNGGFVTREEVEEKNIASWYLYDYVRKNNLVKVSPGFYASEDYHVDEHYMLQRRYPKFIFSGISALFLLGLTDKIPEEYEITCPHGYNPTREKLSDVIIRRLFDPEIYNLGITEVHTVFGNTVKVYDEERTICDLVKRREEYEPEVFVKALRRYIKKTNNQAKLLKYAQILKIEKRVYELMEVIVNDDQ